LKKALVDCQEKLKKLQAESPRDSDKNEKKQSPVETKSPESDRNSKLKSPDNGKMSSPDKSRKSKSPDTKKSKSPDTTRSKSPENKHSSMSNKDKNTDPAEADYVVDVVTANKLGAGTDSNVYLNIYGEKGETGKIHLKKSTNNKDAFEKGKTDIFEIKSKNVGNITKINISHDGEGLGNGWFLESIKVFNKTANNTKE
jgi:hypothetical protein